MLRLLSRLEVVVTRASEYIVQKLMSWQIQTKQLSTVFHLMEHCGNIGKKDLSVNWFLLYNCYAQLLYILSC